MDYETRKVAEVPDEVVAPYGADKIKSCFEVLAIRLWKIRLRSYTVYAILSMAMNGHVNNSKYLEWMLDVFDLDF